MFKGWSKGCRRVARAVAVTYSKTTNRLVLPFLRITVRTRVRGDGGEAKEAAKLGLKLVNVPSPRQCELGLLSSSLSGTKASSIVAVGVCEAVGGCGAATCDQNRRVHLWSVTAFSRLAAPGTHI